MKNSKICMATWSTTVTADKLFQDNNYTQFRLLRDELSKFGATLLTTNEMSLEDADVILFSDVLGYGNYEIIYDCIRYGNIQNSIYFALEPPVVAGINERSKMEQWAKIFKSVITVQSDLDGTDNFIYYSDAIDKTKYDDVKTETTSPQKKLLTSISGFKKSSHPQELYSEREKAYRFFADRLGDQFDFYGIGFDPNEFKAYRGKVASKRETLQNYKFALAYENMDNLNGYVTEKVVDVIKAGAVPIYRGAQNVTDYIDKRCLILASDFKDLDEIADYILNMSEEKYNEYIAAGHAFLNSDAFHPFTPEYFAQKLSKIILNEKKSCFSKRQCKQMIDRFYGVLRLKVRIKKLLGR